MVNDKLGENQALSDFRSEFFKQYPDTILPAVVNRDTVNSPAFKSMYPMLCNIPYWGYMGHDPPVIQSKSVIRALSGELESKCNAR